MRKRNEQIAQQKEKIANRLIKRHRPKIYKAINKAILPAIEIAKNAPNETGANLAAESMDFKELETVLNRAYEQAITTQADHTVSYLTGKSAHDYFKTKADPPEVEILIGGGYGQYTAEQILWAQMVTNWQKTEGAAILRSINQYSKDLARDIINKTIAEGIQNNLDTFDLAKLIEQRVKQEWRRQSVFRADRIARTELHKALAYASEQGAASTGLDLVKQWLTFIDGRERPSHNAANGQIVDFKAKFAVGGAMLKHPSDASGPAEEIINCRCKSIEMVRSNEIN